jgi:molybdopterin biosynthesis enzyme
VTFIEERLRELLKAGADLLITTGGMSVDPDDVTRFAIRNLGAKDITYGSAVLPGAMFLVGYLSLEHSAKSMGQAPSALCTLLPSPSSASPPAACITR